jgi:NADH-quinone oxidoreductase subunit L
MNPHDLAWIILLLPLAATVIITLFTQRDGRLSAKLSIAAVVLSFVFTAALFLIFGQNRVTDATPFDWLSVGNLTIELGLRLDPLSWVMLFIVTGVGGLIHIYSYGYMDDDRGKGRYFASLSLFTFSMLGIVIATNFVQMFIFWELVGVSSYLLIGFWYDRPSAADAGKKAFITNRLGDFGFILGIILIWALLGSVKFDDIRERLTTNPGALGTMSCVAGLLIFCGAVGKSAQFPLHVWLPDAMEGPTPVSALIHAATMVAAGVYMLCRVFFLYDATPAWPQALSFMSGHTALDVIACIGGFTALLAAVIAVQQNDIKRILAYSTLSQLGYMIMAVGVAAPGAAMYHLATHAFFKALLFLGAGSVIHALHHQQEIWEMGGLSRKMPVTKWTFLVGTLAIAGLPPLSGFFSKDEILAAAFHRNSLLFIVATVVAMLTSFYMFRLWFVAFGGKARSELAEHAHESPSVMIWPLRILAILSIFGGVIGINVYLERHLGVPAWAESEVATFSSVFDRLFAPFAEAPLAALAGLAAFAFGASFAFAVYGRAQTDPLPEKLGALSRAMRRRFYFDEIYGFFISITHEALSRLAAAIDRAVIAGAGIRGLHGTTEIFGRALRLVQTGNLQTYAFLFALGVVVVLLIVLIPK